MSLIPEPLRTDPVETIGHTIRELALPGRATVGLAGFATLAAGGLSAAGVARQPVALGVTRLERRGARIWGVPCRGVGPVQAAADVPRGMSFSVSLGSTPNGPLGVYRRGTFTAPVSGTMRVWGSVDNYLTINGTVTLRYGGGSGNVTSATREVTAGQVLTWQAVNTGGFAGGNFSVMFAAPAAETDVLDWRPAVTALEWAAAGSGAGWWGTVDASARAGSWVRRLAWPDFARRIRFVPGAGTTNAVAVDQTGAVLTPDTFGAAEWLAEDWTVVGGDEPTRVDVSDWIFSGPADAVGFFVAGDGLAAADPGDGGSGGSPAPTASPIFYGPMFLALPSGKAEGVLSAGDSVIVGSYFYDKKSYAFSGSPGVRYLVTLRVRGVVETAAYADGTAGDGLSYAGGHNTGAYNCYQLRCSSPFANWFLNAGSNAPVITIDYQFSILVDGEAIFDLWCDDMDRAFYVKKPMPTLPVDSGRPLRNDGVFGQWVQIDVLSAVPG